MGISLWNFSFFWAVIVYVTRSNLLDVLSENYDHVTVSFRLYRCAAVP